jgi:nucleoside 2-deoxyribosyltransferase
VNILIYAAGPLDGLDDDEQARQASWRGELEPPPGVIIFDPGRAYHGVGKHSAVAIDDVNRVIIRQCDGMLAHLDSPARCFGTIREIEYARSMRKPVVIIGELHSLLAHDVSVSATPEAGLSLLISQIRHNRLTDMLAGLHSP